MKRLHIHIAVDDLAKSVDFYSTLLAAPPVVSKHDYAKWLVDDPRLNLSLSKRARRPGLDHLGIQVDDGTELTELSRRLSDSGAATVEQTGTSCCYARSDKVWVKDPQGIAWETFRTHGSADDFEGAEAGGQPTACGESGDGGTAGAAADTVDACCAGAPCGTAPADGREAACCA
ncbi:MAG: ArsI/CadI family heavy metal resistance metalloenzyme [Kiloniellaceae bacterium]